MLLRIFRLNDPYRLLGIFFVLVLASLGYFIDPTEVTLIELKGRVLGESLNAGQTLYSELITNSAPLAALFYRLIEFLVGESGTARKVMALLMLFFQGSFFAILLINNKAQNESTYLPALIFGLLCLFSFDMLLLTPELLASTLLLFALNNLFKEVEFRIQRDSIVLNLGFYLGLASLMVLSYVIFLPGVMIILLLFTRISIRKLMLLVFGFLLPHGLLWVIYYMQGNSHRLWHYFYESSEWFKTGPLPISSMVFLAAIPIAYFVFSLIMLNREARLTKYQSQLLQIMFLWLIISLLEIGVGGGLQPYRVITLAPPLAYFTGHMLLLIRRKWIAESLLWIFVLGIITTSYSARYGLLANVRYEKLFSEKSRYADQITGKKIMILGQDWDLYSTNVPATPFLDWNLSQPLLTRIDNLDNLLFIERAFSTNPPEVVVDPENHMEEVLRKLPMLRGQYRVNGNLYVRISQ